MLKVIAGRKAELKTKDCGGSDCAKGCDGGGRVEDAQASKLERRRLELRLELKS